MIQDIAPWKLRIEFEPRQAEAGDFIFDFNSEGLLLTQGESLRFPTLEEWQALRGDRISMVFQEPMTSLNPVLTMEKQVDVSHRR